MDDLSKFFFIFFFFDIDNYNFFLEYDDLFLDCKKCRSFFKKYVYDDYKKFNNFFFLKNDVLKYYYVYASVW